MKLLDKAKQIKTRGFYSKDEIELALAWAKGEINLVQVSKARGHKVGEASYSFLANCLKRYINEHG